MVADDGMQRPRRDLGGALSVLIWAWVGLMALLCAVAGVVVVLLGGLWWDRDRRVFHRLNTWWGAGLTRTLPIPVEIRGAEHIGRGPYVITPNHQSVVDLLVLYRLPVPYRTVLKRSWLHSPLGLSIRLAGYVPTQRTADRAGAQEVLDRCATWLRRGISVLMFPEGTRSRTWSLRRFKRGAFELAVAEGVPVLPVAIAGSNDLSHPDHWRFSPGGRVIVEVLEPVSGDDVSALRAEVRRRLGSTLTRLRAELRAAGQGPPA